MKISDLKQEQIKPGLQLRSLINRDKIAVVVVVDHNDDDYSWIGWPSQDYCEGGFYGNDCECEVVTDDDGNIIYGDVPKTHMKQFENYFKQKYG